MSLSLLFTVRCNSFDDISPTWCVAGLLLPIISFVHTALPQVVLIVYYVLHMSTYVVDNRKLKSKSTKYISQLNSAPNTFLFE